MRGKLGGRANDHHFIDSQTRRRHKDTKKRRDFCEVEPVPDLTTRSRQATDDDKKRTTVHAQLFPTLSGADSCTVSAVETQNKSRNMETLDENTARWNRIL